MSAAEKLGLIVRPKINMPRSLRRRGSLSFWDRMFVVARLPLVGEATIGQDRLAGKSAAALAALNNATDHQRHQKAPRIANEGIDVMGFKSKSKLPRHVEAKRLADGGLAYYWHVPPYRRIDNCPASLPLGRDVDEVKRKADELNAALDRAGPRAVTRELLGIENNGYLSSVERQGNKLTILSE